MTLIGYLLRYGYVIGAALLVLAVATVSLHAKGQRGNSTDSGRQLDRGANKGAVGRVSGYRYLVGAVLLVFAAGATTLHAYVYHEIFKTPAPAHFQPPRDQEQAQRQDLAYLESSLESIDRSLSQDKRRRFEEALAGVARGSGPIPEASFELGIARAVALDHNGHTNLRSFAWGLSLNSLPIRVGWFAEGLYVIETDPANADLLGARVRTIGGQAPEAMVQVLQNYVGGRPTFAQQLSPHFLESPAALHAAGLIPSPSEVSFDLELPDGRAEERRLQAVPVPVNGKGPAPGSFAYAFWANHWPRRDLSPVAFPGDPRPWKHVLDGLQELPLSLRSPNQLYWATYLLGGQVLYVQLNAVVSQPGRPALPRFLQDVVATARSRKPRYAIVDLRSDSGGDYELTPAFTRDLPRTLPPDGKLFILTSGNTFSAAIVMTARLKFYGGSRAAIIGEPVGDYGQFWAEGSSRIILPNSRLMVSYATGYHDWVHGCTLGQVLICAPENYLYGVAAGSLEPQVSVRWSYRDYAAGKDTVMDTVMSLIGHGEQPANAPRQAMNRP